MSGQHFLGLVLVHKVCCPQADVINQGCYAGALVFLSYRWLTYLLLLILDLVICLALCLGMAKQSRWLLITYVSTGGICLSACF